MDTMIAGLGDPEIMKEMLAAGLLSPEDMEGLGEISMDGDEAAGGPKAIEGATEITDDAVIAAASEIEAQEQREALYADQESIADLTDPAPAPELPASVEKPKAARKAKSPKPPKASTPRAPHASATDAASHVVELAGDHVLLQTGFTPCDTRVLVGSFTARKIVEKVENWFAHFHAGKTLSVYTRAGLEMAAHGEKVTAKTLAAELTALPGKHTKSTRGYADGTARSQAQQIATLLRKLEVIGADGTPNDKSEYLQRFKAH